MERRRLVGIATEEQASTAAVWDPQSNSLPGVETVWALKTPDTESDAKYAIQQVSARLLELAALLGVQQGHSRDDAGACHHLVCRYKRRGCRNPSTPIENPVSQPCFVLHCPVAADVCDERSCKPCGCMCMVLFGCLGIDVCYFFTTRHSLVCAVLNRLLAFSEVFHLRCDQ